ncbi:ATP-dependent zinc protease [Shewanella schlegeliana]|uniref:ATP-dependent zinc protease n=1 Tax=Shewanella schlegeliana TaxID=190308 RepID=A0ABS1STZ3_9GAMM|nr:ATP-dependent zinc protease [Shewanella schlegeliana]MBL4912014.1 ATP-dependent zinc protease [Shewanella schlegeliana]MCL1111610.1 ATP-dependent zinc protease [Shewanella schlegeliana]GIU35341.1 ATP-dependent Zn protease [Shewanella schlegeliana]
MFKQIICIAAITAVISGCATTKDTNAPIPVDAAALEASLTKQETNILEAIDSCNQAQSAGYAQLSSQVEALNAKVAQLDVKKEAAVVPVVTPVQCPPSPIGDKFILGAIENVYVEEVKASFNTRIDTGAESSSLDARNIILFERDGSQWVRFDVFTQGDKQPAKTFESKVERFVRIKQDADDKSDRRPVIHAHLEIGPYKAETDLNLSDRSHLEYPLLLGRKFMQDIAVVDVGQTYIHGKKQDAKPSKTK